MAVFQLVHDDLLVGRDLVVENQVATGGQEQAAVGVDAAAKTEVRAGEVAAVITAEHAKLKDWNQRDFHLARHVHGGARRTRGDDLHASSE